MFFLYELIIVVSYLINGILGLLSFLSISIIILMKKKSITIEEKIIDLMILSLPLHSISIIGDKMHHILSWPIIMILIILIYNIRIIIKNKIKISTSTKIMMIICIFLLLISNLKNPNKLKGIIEICQILIMVIPIITTYISKDIIIKKISKNYINNTLDKIESVILAVCLGTLIQYIVYQCTGNILGRISFFYKREVFDLFFKAFSVLSIFLGLGIIIATTKLIKKFSVVELIKIIFFVMVIGINSSRTGLIAAIITIFIMFSSKIFNLEKKQKIFLYGILAISAIISIIYIIQFRGELGNIFSGNERMDTYKYGIDLLKSDIRILLLGNGLDYSIYNNMLPHNSILETLVCCGLIFTSITIFGIIRLIKYIKTTKYKFLIFHIIIASMFITCFQGNPFTTIIIILAIIDESFYCKKGVENDKKRRFDNNSCTNI